MVLAFDKDQTVAARLTEMLKNRIHRQNNNSNNDSSNGSKKKEPQPDGLLSLHYPPCTEQGTHFIEKSEPNEGYNAEENRRRKNWFSSSFCRSAASWSQPAKIGHRDQPMVLTC